MITIRPPLDDVRPSFSGRHRPEIAPSRSSIEVGLLGRTIGPAGTRRIEGQAIGLGQHSRGDGVNINNSLVAADKDNAMRQLFDNSQRRRRELRRKAEPFVHLDRPLEMGGQPLQQFDLVGRRGPRVSRPHNAEEAKSTAVEQAYPETLEKVVGDQKIAVEFGFD